MFINLDVMWITSGDGCDGPKRILYDTFVDLMSMIMNVKDHKTRSDYSLPLPVRRVLRKLGRDIRDARLRRRITAAVLAERASITRATLLRVEKGEPGVSIGIVATVLFVLGLSNRIGELADVKRDEQGLALEAERLPKRVRARRKPVTKPRTAPPDAEDR